MGDRGCQAGKYVLETLMRLGIQQSPVQHVPLRAYPANMDHGGATVLLCRRLCTA